MLFLFGCHREKVAEIDVVARVENYYLTRSQLDDWLPPGLKNNQKDAVARQYIERWVQRTTLYLSAREEGITLSPYEQWSLDNLKRELLADKYLRAKQPQKIIVTDEEISNYYKENQEEFVREQSEVNLIQLFLENLDKAIAREIRESKSLLKVIRKNYLDKQENRLLEKNGDLGYVPLNSLRKEVLRYAKNGKTGKIYGPIRLASGYYYFQMMDKQPEGSYRSLDLVKEQIKLRLMNIKREKINKNLAKKNLENYRVEIFPEHIN
ncbi:hypothetical protein B1H10_08230 [candidate division KSB1 bacterium 4484_188]|nr:MAG: hypothetical protein B1H10_08230 [candidate division KSB1 bacterium 4484_188]